MKEKLLEASQKFSRAVIQPVMFMSITGTVIAVAVILKLDAMPEILKTVGNFIYNMMMNGNMNQLSIIFCVGIGTAMAKRKKVDAAILSLITFLLFIHANNAWLVATNQLVEMGPFGLGGTGQTMMLGVQIIDMGVFLGILLGCTTAYIFNKFSEVEFIDMFRIYGGSRFAFMIMIIVVMFMSIGLSYVWPVVNSWITLATGFISNSGSFGVFLYGFFNRFLIPTGLHHLVYMPFLFTPIGGTLEVGGTIASGASFIMAAQLGNLGNITALDESIRFLMFGFGKVFGCTGICLAFIKTAKPQNKAKVKGLLIPALFVAVIAGITEPFDFAFLFISPLLWFIHALLDGFFQMLIYILGVRASFSGGLLNAFTSNVIIPMGLTKIHILFIVGFIAIFVWYFIFVFLINKLNLKTPGREDDEGMDESVVSIAQGGAEKTDTLGDIKDIVEGLGGKENIETVNNCFTRLRVEVKNVEFVNNDIINKYKNSGIVKKGNNIQIIIGMKVQSVKEDVCQFLNIE